MWKCGWCSNHKLPHTRSDMNEKLDFLSGLFENGLECRTVGTYRFPITAFYDPTGSIGVSNHPRASAFIPGIFNKSPPQSKKFLWLGRTLWDVETLFFEM